MISTSVTRTSEKFSKVNMLRLGVYKHYKGADGGEYSVIGVAEHENTGEQLVVYQALYGERVLYVRPLSQFTENVTVKGIAKPRFLWLREKE